MADLYRPYSQGLLSEEPTRLEDMYAPAATGLLFAPGAGVADLMGQAPDPSRPGEMLPSFYENITGGNYLDAGLQALGGAGDAVQMMGAAFPPAIAVGAAMKAPRGIRAYHGSPYHFDRFRLDKIGTGEGAQAYGRGLYFAEAEPTAMSYRDELRAMKDLQQDFTIKYKDNILGDPNTLKYSDDPLEEAVGRIASEMKMSSVYADKALSNLIDSDMKYIERIKAQKTDDPETQEINDLLIKSTEREIERLKQVDPADISFDRGAMYEVNIAADPENFLNYQDTIANMPDQVRARLYKNPEIKEFLDKRKEDGMRPEFYTGGTFYDEFSDYVGGESVASDILNEAGIPGIKYLDLGSRGGAKSLKDATNNYVVFDDSLIEIMRKYGLLAPLVGAGTVAAVSDMGEDRGLLEM